MRRTAPLPLAAAALLVLTACTPGPAPDGGDASPDASTAADATGTLLARHGLSGMDGREVVDHLEALDVADRPDDLVASVRVDGLLLGDGSAEATLPLPDDVFYLSVAPFVDETHDCFFHSLTTCQGELAGEEVSVSLVDAGSGEVLVDEDVVLGSNGFAGFWLPRGVDARLTVESDGRTGTATVSTTPDDPTCLTTLRLV